MRHNLQAVLTQIGLVCLMALAATSVSFAQSDLTEEADALFDRGGYAEAINDYIQAYAKIKDITDKGYAAFMAGESFRLMLDPASAEEWYDKAIGLKYYKDEVDVFLHYGDIMLTQQEFDEAIEWYMTYKENGGDPGVADSRIMIAEEGAFNLDEPPSRYIVENLILLNSGSYDFGLGFASKKSDEVVFASSRESSTGSGEDPITGESFMDLFRAEQDKKGRWSTPEPLNNTVNTDSNEGTVTFDKKFKTMYFTRCTNAGKSNLACDIFKSSVMGTRMGPAEPLNIIDRVENDSSQVGHPCITPDDLHLLFSSDMPGGHGGKDLWYITYDKKKDSWSDPTNLGAGINTADDEMFPHVRFDGSLYFASNGHIGMGGLDIFKAEAGSAPMTFGEPEVLAYPLNSSSDDFGIVFYTDEDRGILTSNRPGGKGKDDLYSFRMPELEFCYRANIYDYDTGVPLMGDVTVQGSDGQSWQLKADGDGAVELCEKEISKENSYNVDVAMTSYIGTGDRFSTAGLMESTTFAREYFLKEIFVEKEYPMPLVLYPFDEATLLITSNVNSKDSLDYLVDLMERNATFVIKLESHTDTRGVLDYNMELSQKRAQTCVDYLISNGISSDRLEAVGRGMTSPILLDSEINKMATEADKEAAHQLNRRTVFKIIRFDYLPGE